MFFLCLEMMRAFSWYIFSFYFLVSSLLCSFCLFPPSELYDNYCNLFIPFSFFLLFSLYSRFLRGSPSELYSWFHRSSPLCTQGRGSHVLLLKIPSLFSPYLSWSFFLFFHFLIFFYLISPSPFPPSLLNIASIDGSKLICPLSRLFISLSSSWKLPGNFLEM